MALQNSGAISLADIAAEFGGTAPHSMSEYYRGGAFTTDNNGNVPASGLIRMGNFHGSVNQFGLVIASNVSNGVLSTLATNAGWDGSAPMVVTINSNVWLWATSTSSYGLTVDVPNVPIVNYGRIIGRGGNAGERASNGGSGGHALRITAGGVTITNASGAFIAGGGGGGGPGYWSSGGNQGSAGGGGGAGGGNGSRPTYNGSYNGSIPQGGGLGATGQHGYNHGGAGSRGLGGGAGGGAGTAWGGWRAGGGAGGRILPGSGGTGGGNNTTGYYSGGDGGNGGSANGAGEAGRVLGNWSAGGGGGGWGASGGQGRGSTGTNRNGGSGGRAISATTSYTLSNSGTIYGAT